MKNFFSGPKNRFLLVMLLFLAANSAVMAQFKLYGTATADENSSGYGALALDDAYYVGSAAPGVSGITKIKATSTLDWVWTRYYPAPNTGDVLSISQIQESHSGNLIALGTISIGGNAFNRQLIVLEIHRNTGNVLQSKVIQVGGTHRLIAAQIVKVSDCEATSCDEGAYVIKSWLDNGADDIFVCKIDNALNLVWANTFDGGGSDDEANGMIAANLSTNPGGVVISGSSSLGGTWRGFVIELDCNGVQIPSRCVAYGPTGGNFLSYGLSRAFNGDILLSGFSETPAGSGNHKGLVARIRNSNLAVTWSRTKTIPGNLVNFLSVTQRAANNGHVYTMFTPNNGEPTMYKWDFATGAINQRRELGPGVATYLTGTSTRVLVHGHKTVPTGVGMRDMWFGVMDVNMTTCGNPINDSTEAIQLVRTNNYLFISTNRLPMLTTTPYCDGNSVTYSLKDACGISNRPNGGGQTSDVSQQISPAFKIGETVLGEEMAVNVAVETRTEMERPTETPNLSDSKASEIFPNPATNVLNVRINTAATETLVEIRATDGRVLNSVLLNDAVKQYGFDISDLPTGLYFVKIGEEPMQKFTKQ